MRVENLELSRGYYNDKPLQGSLTLKDANGSEIKVPLSPAAISRLIAAIAREVNTTVKQIASDAPRALQRAEDEGLLLENNGEI